MRRPVSTGIVLAMLVAPVVADEATDPGTLPDTHASIALERHHTTNALDAPYAVADWYGLLRGSLDRTIELPEGTLRLSAEGQATRHDRVHIEDDRGASLGIEATHRLNARTEMRGTLSWTRYSEGDDLLIADTIVGIRTLTDTIRGGVEVGFDLGNDTVLTLAGSNTLERPRETRFQLDVLPPTRLEPERNRVNFAARLMRGTAPLAYGLKAEGEWTDVAAGSLPPIGYSYALFSLRAEAAYKPGNGASLSGAFGAQWMRAGDGAYEKLRPAMALEYTQTFANGIALRGALAARYETVDTDDPLASWLRRGEIEVKAPVSRRVTLGAGLFAEVRENVALGYDQRRRGAYARLACKATETLSLVLQLGYTRERVTAFDARKDSFDTFAGLKKEI